MESIRQFSNPLVFRQVGPFHQVRRQQLQFDARAGRYGLDFEVPLEPAHTTSRPPGPKRISNLQSYGLSGGAFFARHVESQPVAAGLFTCERLKAIRLSKELSHEGRRNRLVADL